MPKNECHKPLHRAAVNILDGLYLLVPCPDWELFYLTHIHDDHHRAKHPCTYPEYANGCDFCANKLAYAKCGNGSVQHAYFLTNLKYANKLPKHMSRGYICTCRVRHASQRTRARTSCFMLKAGPGNYGKVGRD